MWVNHRITCRINPTEDPFHLRFLWCRHVQFLNKNNNASSKSGVRLLCAYLKKINCLDGRNFIKVRKWCPPALTLCWIEVTTQVIMSLNWTVCIVKASLTPADINQGRIYITCAFAFSFFQCNWPFFHADAYLTITGR